MAQKHVNACRPFAAPNHHQIGVACAGEHPDVTLLIHTRSGRQLFRCSAIQVPFLSECCTKFPRITVMGTEDCTTTPKLQKPNNKR
eukprot:5249491-Amphidinium_carterae.1